MRYLLDTMIVSEAAKPAPSAGVLAWLEEQAALDLAISVLTLGEIGRGVARMEEGRRKRLLGEWMQTSLPAHFEGRILPVDEEIARAWGELTAEADRSGRPLHVIDGLLLATARAHDLTLVTRNVRDFQDRGQDILDPYR